MNRRERERRERERRERERAGVDVVKWMVLIAFVFGLLFLTFMYFFRNSELVDYVTEFNNLPEGEQIRRLQRNARYFNALQGLDIRMRR